MEWLLAGLGVVLVVADRVRKRRPRAPSPRRLGSRPLLEAVARLGLEWLPEKELGAPAARGVVRGFEVVVALDPGDKTYQIEVYGRGKMPEKVVIGYSATAAIGKDHSPTGWTPEQVSRLRRLGSWLGSSVDGPRAEIGDPRMEVIQVRGDAAMACALLDASNRDRLLAAIGRFDATLISGAVAGLLEIPASSSEMVDALDALLDLADALTMEVADIPARLAANAAADPVPAVQRANLKRLIADYPATSDTAACCRGLLDATDAELRLIAAAHLGDEAVAVAVAIVRDPALDESLRVRALEWVMRMESRARAADVVADLLAGPPSALRLAAIAAAGGLDGSRLIEGLVALAPAADIGTAVALASVLAAHGPAHGARVEKDLLRCLGAAGGTDKQRIARALGEIGTARSVATLRELTQEFWDGRLRLEAELAIAVIQSRLGPIDPGRLSLSDTDSGGALSQPEGDGGGLSVAQEPRSE